MIFRCLVLPSPGLVKNVLLSIWLGTIEKSTIHVCCQVRFSSTCKFSLHVSIHSLKHELGELYHLSLQLLLLGGIITQRAWLRTVYFCGEFEFWSHFRWIERSLVACAFSSVKSRLKQTLNIHIIKYSSFIAVNETLVYISATNITRPKLF